MPFTYEIHHIFRVNRIENTRIKAAIEQAGFNIEARANKVSLFLDSDTAATFGNLPSAVTAGFGASDRRIEILVNMQKRVKAAFGGAYADSAVGRFS